MLYCACYCGNGCITVSSGLPVVLIVHLEHWSYDHGYRHENSRVVFDSLERLFGGRGLRSQQLIFVAFPLSTLSTWKLSWPSTLWTEFSVVVALGLSGQRDYMGCRGSCFLSAFPITTSVRCLCYRRPPRSRWVMLFIPILWAGITLIFIKLVLITGN